MSVYGTGIDGSFRFGGATGFRSRSVTAAYTVNKVDDQVVLAANAGGMTVTLPPAAACFSDSCGMRFLIVNVGAAGTVTVDGDGAETINGNANVSLASQYASVLVQSTGSAWVALNDLVNITAASDLTLSGTLDVAGVSTFAGAVVAEDAVTVEGTFTAEVPAVMDDIACVDLAATGAVDLSGATVTFAANEIDSADIIAGAIDEVHLATTRARTVAADGALTLAATDSAIALLSSTAGDKAATMTATHNGHRIKIVLQARSGGSYTLAASYAGASGTVTLDAAAEGVELMRVGAAWLVLQLLGSATFA